MARAGCPDCRGLGERRGRVCECVYRHVAQACAERARVPVEMTGSAFRREAEWRADVTAVAQRVLGQRDWELWRLHRLSGIEGSSLAARLGIPRWRFYRLAERVDAVVGRALLETRPYAVWPVDEYMSVRRRTLVLDGMVRWPGSGALAAAA